MRLVDNLYVIIGIAATKFNSEQLDYLLAQITKTWNDNSFKLHDKLVGLLRIIGREAKSNKTYSKVKYLTIKFWKFRIYVHMKKKIQFN